LSASLSASIIVKVPGGADDREERRKVGVGVTDKEAMNKTESELEALLGE
jgi:hypothetical protein